MYNAYEVAGMWAVQAAEDWIDKRVKEGYNVPTNEDGKYGVSCDIYIDTLDGTYCANAMVGTVDSSDILTRVAATSAYGNNGYNDAYDNTKDILNANPDCRIFICYWYR